jgi:hypothetical protein
MKTIQLLISASLLALVGCGSGSSDSVGTPGTQVPDTQTPNTGSPGAELPEANTLSWYRPDHRENGEYLEIDELGGYELRYREGSEGSYSSVIIEDPWQDEFHLSSIVDVSTAYRYEYQIAAFDSSGLYSQFVSLEPSTN